MHILHVLLIVHGVVFAITMVIDNLNEYGLLHAFIWGFKDQFRAEMHL